MEMGGAPHAGGTNAAEAGSDAAERDAFLHGMAYDLGRGVPRNRQLALVLYRQAADAGHPLAALDAAILYDSGQGTPRNPYMAAAYYAMAASRGVARAAYDLGLLYADGDGVPRNGSLARAWFKQAAAENLSAAADRLRQDERTLTGADAAPPPVPLAPSLVSPATSATLREGPDIALIWTADTQPGPALYLVEVVSLADGAPQVVFSTETELSAVTAPLGQKPGRYAWRVFTVCPSLGQYVASAWTMFSIG